MAKRATDADLDAKMERNIDSDIEVMKKHGTAIWTKCILLCLNIDIYCETVNTQERELSMMFYMLKKT